MKRKTQETLVQPDDKARRSTGAGVDAKQDGNHGEGNPEAAARFNKSEQAFIRSQRGQQRIREAGDVRPDEEAQLEEAERIARSLPKDTAASEDTAKQDTDREDTDRDRRRP